MDRGRQRSIARWTATATAAAILVFTTVLTVNYLRARAALPVDDARIADLVDEVSRDASRAPALADEHARISAVRQARRRLDDVLGIALIGCAAVFIGAAKWHRWLCAGRRPPSSRRLPTTSDADLVPPPASAARAATAPQEIDPNLVDELIATYGSTREAAVPILQALQDRCGYLPDEALRRICEHTDIGAAQIAGTSSFYARFRRSPVGDHVLRVCHGTACHVGGARSITDELRRRLGIAAGEDTDPQRRVTIDEVACLGCCSLAPVMMLDERTLGRLSPATARGVLASLNGAPD